MQEMAPRKLPTKRSRKDTTGEGSSAALQANMGFDRHRFRSAEHQQLYETIKAWPFHRERHIQLREEEQAEAERKAEEAKKQQSRTAAEEEYERMVLISNTNRDDSIIEARTLDDAIAQMTVVDNLPPDRHPERRLKASFKV